MGWERPISEDSLLNMPRGSRQYWQGQCDTLAYCARVLRSIADQNPTSKQLKQLASAIETKARLTAINKLGDTMANIPTPAYEGKALTPTPTSQQSQGRATERRSGSGDPALIRSNEPAMPEDRKLGSGNSGPLGSSGKANVRR